MESKGTDIPLSDTLMSFFPVPQPIISGNSTTTIAPTGPFSIHPIYVTLGLQGNTRVNGLIGSLRNFQLFNVVLSEEELKNTPFTYLHP